MRIDLRTAYDPASVEQPKKAPANAPDQLGKITSAEDTATNVRLSGLEDKVSSSPEIRQERVDRLRQAITSGTYSVSDESLAEAMLKDSLKR